VSAPPPRLSPPLLAESHPSQGETRVSESGINLTRPRPAVSPGRIFHCLANDDDDLKYDVPLHRCDVDYGFIQPFSTPTVDHEVHLLEAALYLSQTCTIAITDEEDELTPRACSCARMILKRLLPSTGANHPSTRLTRPRTLLGEAKRISPI
jgi:hypothetical protein